MGICCQTAQEGPILDPLEPPDIIEIERPVYTSSISSRIYSDDLWRNKEEEVVDTQIYQISHTKDFL